MRPSPTDVRLWFAQPVDGMAAQTLLRALRVDPNWMVLYPPQLPLDSLTLVYMPTGERLTLQRLGSTAHPSWQAVTAIG